MHLVFSAGLKTYFYTEPGPVFGKKLDKVAIESQT
jgi:hypothetical protein